MKFYIENALGEWYFRDVDFDLEVEISISIHLELEIVSVSHFNFYALHTGPSCHIDRA